ncbi:MAG: type II toxin-antitoxin system VapB family antitoxin [Candidatus Omnitrophica bacterium]|nr:type II toxin-antitoxin system VapB family antitoxin [Candidatus Omnitrophota bacterium]
MRTTIDINEGLLKKVIRLAKVKTKKEAVALSMEAFLHQKRLQNLVSRLGRGQLRLTQSDLGKMRER